MQRAAEKVGGQRLETGGLVAEADYRQRSERMMERFRRRESMGDQFFHNPSRRRQGRGRTSGASSGEGADCRLPIADCRLPIADCRLPIVDCGLWIVEPHQRLSLCAANNGTHSNVSEHSNHSRNPKHRQSRLASSGRDKQSSSG